MRIKDVINWLEINPKSALSWMVREMGMKQSDVDPNDECPLPLMLEMSNAFPSHVRTVVIKVRTDETGEPESLEATMIGKWSGLMMRLASRKFDKLYKEYIYSLRKGHQRREPAMPLQPEVEGGNPRFISGTPDPVVAEPESPLPDELPAEVVDEIIAQVDEEEAQGDPEPTEVTEQKEQPGPTELMPEVPSTMRAQESTGSISISVPRRCTVVKV
jgi:hypothetical protein